MAKSKKLKVKDSSTKYTGIVTIRLKHGNKTYKTIKGKNAGCKHLFKFLALCLANQYEENLRPRLVKLYAVDNSEDVLVTPFAIPHNGIAITEYDDSCGVKMSFLIPYQSVTGVNISKLKLFNVENVLDESKPSAEYTLTEPIVLSDNRTNIELDWELKISNK